MTKEIQLTKGKVTLVDDEDYEWLSQWKWYCDNGLYAARKPWHQDLIYMHRIVVNTPNGMDTDHINGNGLDNRKCNLRICTHSQNLMNAKIPNTNKSGVRGVFWHKLAKKWMAQITINKKSVYIGLFENIKDAANAYSIKSKELFGEFERKK